MAYHRRKSARPTRWRPNRSRSLPKECFLGSNYSYPVCPVGRRSPTCRGLIAAYSRAATVAGRARRHGTKGGPRARSVMRKASSLRKKHGCEHVWDKFKKSRSLKKKSRSPKKKSRSRRKCKHGALKHPVRLPSGAKRYCKKSKSKRRSSKKKSRSPKKRRSSKKKSRSRRKCKHGVLKSPVKLPSGAKRYCKKSKSKRRSSKKKSRSLRKRSGACKYGKLKTPVKTPSGGVRHCKKRRSQKYGGNKGDESRSRRDYAHKRKSHKRK